MFWVRAQGWENPINCPNTESALFSLSPGKATPTPDGPASLSISGSANPLSPCRPANPSQIPPTPPCIPSYLHQVPHMAPGAAKCLYMLPVYIHTAESVWGKYLYAPLKTIMIC